MESRYSVRQTADMTGVKPYVLRYWEEELGIVIQRNEMGHRYYTGEDIQLFLSIKELKRKGLQLRAVKDLLPELMENIHAEALEKQRIAEQEKCIVKDKEKKEKLQELKEVLKAELTGKQTELTGNQEETGELEENTRRETTSVHEVTGERDEAEFKENDEPKILEFQSILERLILRELSARDEEEEKCRSLDMAIRRQQMVRKEAAAASEKKNGRRRHT